MKDPIPYVWMDLNATVRKAATEPRYHGLVRALSLQLEELQNGKSIADASIDTYRRNQRMTAATTGEVFAALGEKLEAQHEEQMRALIRIGEKLDALSNGATAPAPEPEKKGKPGPKPGAKGPTAAAVKKKCAEVMRTDDPEVGKADLKKILGEFEVTKVSDLPKEKFAEVVARCDEIIAARTEGNGDAEDDDLLG